MTKKFTGEPCKMGQGAECCRYLIGTPEGLGCGKLNKPVRTAIDARAERMKAQGDNCDGVDKNLTWEFHHAS